MYKSDKFLYSYGLLLGLGLGLGLLAVNVVVLRQPHPAAIWPAVWMRFTFAPVWLLLASLCWRNLPYARKRLKERENSVRGTDEPH